MTKKVNDLSFESLVEQAKVENEESQKSRDEKLKKELKRMSDLNQKQMQTHKIRLLSELGRRKNNGQ